MIDEIQVENLALIEQASFAPGAGLTVLTGETGAGKTALLSACKLLMGERANAAMVRDGAAELRGSGRFFLQTTAEAPEDAEQVVLRRVSADGRSRASINGNMASAGELAGLIGPQIDLCGQHEHQRLLKPSAHLNFLDAWAESALSDALASYQQAFSCAEQAAEELRRVQELTGAQGAALDEARFILRRINEVNPQENEYEELLSVLERAENAEALIMAASTAREALQGDDAALDALNTAIVSLERGARYDASLQEYAQTLREAVYVSEDVARQICAYCDEIEFDAQDLARMQERVSALQGLMRTYGPRMEDVFEHRARAEELVSLADNSQERIQQANKVCALAEADLEAAANTLDDARKRLIPEFEAAVNARLECLHMGGASLECAYTRLERNAWSKQSPSAFEFMFKPGAGMAARPLSRIASGGEVSRVMLALKVVLGAADCAETLIFDEIDAGVGGATAKALADVLAELAEQRQVIVVTHLASVAARAQTHFLVEKSADEMPKTSIRELTREERVAEIARMLSGDTSETSLAHARELLGSLDTSPK